MDFAWVTFCLDFVWNDFALGSLGLGFPCGLAWGPGSFRREWTSDIELVADTPS